MSGLSRQFRVITPDLRGFGKIATPDDRGSIQTYAHDMLGLMNQLGISKVIIGGHSMGCQITLQMDRQASERFLGMLLIDTNATGASVEEQAEWPGFGAQAEQLGVPSFVPTVTGRMHTGTGRLNDPPLAETMMDIRAEASVNGVKGGGQALATRPDFTGLLPEIAVSTLVIVGTDDPIYASEVSETLQAAIPGAALAIVPQAEHASIFEQPASADAAITRWAAQHHLR